ncbi:MAG: MBL fold metallo-hydrolase [Hyphomicrobiaceae bacterium]|nr:MBL fold metallo-hydrolase [Hyphomicrobiaceae bacterium]MCC0024392.1 MBL fold metallo-hydrolase [Hyphomicrobiaceae bacterium]
MHRNTPGLTRRRVIQAGTALVAAAAVPGLSSAAMAASHTEMNNSIPSSSGKIDIMPVNHASLALVAPGLTLYSDPVGDPSLYADLPAPDLVLITHEHGDHFNTDTLRAITDSDTPLVVNPGVFAKLPSDLQSRATAIANNNMLLFGDMRINAIPAYNTSADRLQYHPQGRDNGYVLELDGTRVYIAGDTEDTPEMRALTGVDLAFVPMNLPYTMDIEQAASGVLAFAPKVIYPYHYRGSDLEAFKSMVDAGGKEIDVRLYDWYG